jgi:hypothetical protein
MFDTVCAAMPDTLLAEFIKRLDHPIVAMWQYLRHGDYLMSTSSAENKLSKYLGAFTVSEHLQYVKSL